MIPPCLTLGNIRSVSRVKWSNPGKGIAPSPTLQCSSYWKGSLLVALDYGRQLIIMKGFRTVVIIFIAISTTFRPICLLTFFRCLSNLGTYRELWTTSFNESTRVACSDSINHNWVQVLRIPIFLLACSQDRACSLQMVVSL